MSNLRLDAYLAGTLDESTLRPPAGESFTERFRSLRVRERSLDTADELVREWIGKSRRVEAAARQRECQDNLKRLSLAMILYEFDHGGGHPEGDWREAVRPYLRDRAGQGGGLAKLSDEKMAAMSHCPLRPFLFGSDRTDYALVRYAGRPGPVVFVELALSISWAETNGCLSASEASSDFTNRMKPFPTATGLLGSDHGGGAQFGFRDGSVRFIPKTMDLDELRAMFGLPPEVKVHMK